MKKLKNSDRVDLRIPTHVKSILSELAIIRGISNSAYIRMLILEDQLRVKQQLQAAGMPLTKLENVIR